MRPENAGRSATRRDASSVTTSRASNRGAARDRTHGSRFPHVNAGKTTFLRAIDPHQRVVTVEAYITELGLHQGDRLPNTVALRKELLAH